MTQKEKHLLAMNDFIDKVKDDPHVIALLLWGSLSYYEVWEKSNIEFTMLVRDKSASVMTHYYGDAGGYRLDLHLIEVSEFKEALQQSRAGEFWHSAWSKGTIVYTKDESLLTFFDEARQAGKDDLVLSFVRAVDSMMYGVTKAGKWITVYGNALYAQRFLHMAYLPVADMVLMQHGVEPTRESVIKAMELEPAFMHEVFVVPTTTAMTVADVQRVLGVMEAYLAKHMDWWSKPLLRFLSDGEEKTASHIRRQLQVGDCALDFLAERGIIAKITKPARLFKKSKLTIDEVAYIYHREEQI